MGTQMKAALGIVTVLLLFTICKSWIFDSDVLLKKVFDPLNVIAYSHYCNSKEINDSVVIEIDLSNFPLGYVQGFRIKKGIICMLFHPIAKGKHAKL